MLASSLWPYRFGGKIQNDVVLLCQTWRWPKAAITQVPAHWFRLEAEESQRQGDNLAAGKWIEDGLRLYPDSYALEWLQALTFMKSRQYEKARRAYAILLGKYGKSEQVRFSIFNNVAYVNILSGDARLLEQADECSRHAFEKYPGNYYFKGTRGSVLVEMGRYEEGLQLLCQALKQHVERPGQALDACYIAIGEARRGRFHESRSFFTLARRLDAKCFLLERESREDCKSLVP
jgi:tetratricopeptide (TPR) repeat protein